MQEDQKTFIIVAGPNGAGKTTFIENTFIQLISENKFINADHFARDLNPENVSKVAMEAGRLFLQKLDILISRNSNFVTETTLSGKSLLKKIEKAKTNNFHVKLIFLSLSSAALCDFRVKARVASGGHNIQVSDMKRRYKRGLINLPVYMKAVDSFELYNADSVPKIVLSQNSDDGKTIHDVGLHQEFKKISFFD